MQGNIKMLDRLIIEFDKSLRTVLSQPHAGRARPDNEIADGVLGKAEKSHVASLMRVNHCGEVCAQALYSGQSLTSRNPVITHALREAAIEETDHLAWCEGRIKELGGRKSLLNPLWYAGAFSMGIVAGALGDKWNLGFLAETEKQVAAHLGSHLEKLPADDHKTRAIIDQMYADESAHAATAQIHGAADLPAPIKIMMRLASKVMTKVAYYL